MAAFEEGNEKLLNSLLERPEIDVNVRDIFFNFFNKIFS